MEHMEKAMKLLDDKDLLDSLYGFAYKRCSNSHEAEDLCSEIILSVVISLHKNPEIANFHAFLWTIAHRVYSDFCEKRKKLSTASLSDAGLDEILNLQINPVENFLENEEEQQQIARILREISFLSKIYRDVMILYYVDEQKIPQIAKMLHLSETAVKQRLFSARNMIKEETSKMDQNYALKPVDIDFIGTGNPVGNDPRYKAERVLSKNVIYLCKNQALSAKEISEKLGVPMPFIEDELEIQVKGENGTYGLLRKLDHGKYISNFLILDKNELEEGTAVYQKYMPQFCQGLKETMLSNKQNILSFPFLSKQENLNFILWPLIAKMTWELDRKVREALRNKYFSAIDTVKHDFTLIGIAVKSDEKLDFGFYGCDGINAGIGARDICGYCSVYVSNVYGERMDKHFGCGHNLSTDPLLLLTIRTINGLDIGSLTEEEKEYAAKAIECGYLRKDNNSLTPKIIVIPAENQNDFYGLLSGFYPTMQQLAVKIADELSGLIKKHVPKHLINEYQMYSMAASIRILRESIEYCIKQGILTAPKSRLCAEGVLMYVQK